MLLHACLLALVLAVVHARRPGQPELPPHLTPHHADMLVVHLRGDAALPPGRWLFFGDSIVESLPVEALGVPAVNYGIGADDTVGIAARLPSYDSVPDAAAVVLGVGINDLARGSPETALAGWSALLDTIPVGPRVVCLGTLPVDERVGAGDGRRALASGRTNAAVTRLGAGIERLCRARGHDFVPAPPELAGPDGNLRAGLHTGDGIHPGPAGYALWLARLDPALRALSNTAR